jgi:hypothetical protein
MLDRTEAAHEISRATVPVAWRAGPSAAAYGAAPCMFSQVSGLPRIVSKIMTEVSVACCSAGKRP